MAGEMLEMGVKMRKVMIFTIRRCFRSVCNNPILVGVLCFLLFLYRSSPFVFSLLLSASPVLVCTAVLLGTLLSFGQPNIPEIERDEKITQEIAPLKTEVLGDAIVVEKTDGYALRRVTHGRGETVKQLNEEPYSASNRTNDIYRGDMSNSNYPLIEERSGDLKFGSEVIEGGRELYYLGFGLKNETHDDRLGDREAKTDDEQLESENGRSSAESFDSERVNVDSLDSPPSSPWKHVGQEQHEEMEEEEEEEEEGVDSGSDGAESSSPDASMADAIPMLDELHPLLDEDAPQPTSLSHDESDAASECSAKSSESSGELDDNIKKHEEVEAADEDNEEADDEDETHGSKEGGMKSAITWTEEDQKNLMDLGCSELERNQRLESLIARRRARKTMSMILERNLTDLECVDLPFHVPPISTAKNNPFDFPHDSYDNVGLPPIPVSAPSILLKRQNPFDLPYDSSEEKPDLTDDSFQQEFTSFQPKEPFFRRHESFNVGPSIFGRNRPEVTLRPYFVPERTDSEGTSYSAFQRQSSGLSDSKGSSVPDTDSVVSAADVEDKNFMEEKIPSYAGALSSVDELELMVPAGGLDLPDEVIPEEPELVLKNEDNNLSEEDICEEMEPISAIEHVSEHVGHGSQSSEEVGAEFVEVEKREIKADEGDIVLQDPVNQREAERIVFDEKSIASFGELNDTEIHSNAESAKQGYRSASSSSSSSELSERIFSKREAEDISKLDERRDDIFEEVGISTWHSLGRLDVDAANALAGDMSLKDPIYDSSPSAVRTDLSSSSMSSDLHVESEMALPPVLIERTVSFAEKNSEFCGQDTSTSSSLLHPLDDQSESRTDLAISSHDLSKVEQVTDSTSAQPVPESIANHDSIDSRSSLGPSVEADMCQPDSHEYVENQISSSISVDVQAASHGVLHQTVESVANFSGDQSLALSKKQLHSQPVEQVLDLNRPPTECQPMVEHSVDEEVTFQPDQGQDPSSNSTINSDAGVSIKPEKKQISFASEDKYISEFDEELVFLDKTADETSSRDHWKGQETSVVLEKRAEESITGDNLNVSGVQELAHEASPNIISATSPRSMDIPSGAYESREAEEYSDGGNNSTDRFENHGQFQALDTRKFLAEAANSHVHVQTIEDVKDDLKEIDEVLLSELDTIGDFSVNESGSAFEKHVVSGGDSSSLLHVGKPGSSAIDGNSILYDTESIMTSEKLDSYQVVDFDTHGEEVKSVSEPQTSGTRDIEHTVSIGYLIGEVQSCGDVKPIESKSLPRGNENDNLNSRVVQFPDLDTSTEMPVLARSKEDVESIFKIVELTSLGAKKMHDRSEMSGQDQVSKATYSTNSGVPVLEAQTLLDIDSAFKQIGEKEIEKPNTSEAPHAEEPVAVVSSYQEQHEDLSLTEPKMKSPISEGTPTSGDLDLQQSHEANIMAVPGSVEPSTQPCLHAVDPTASELLITETRSVEDVTVPAKQVSESCQDKVLESSSSHRSAEVKTKVVGTFNAIQSSDKQTGVKELSKSADENLDAEVEKPESLTVSDVKGKGKNSHKSSSSSSSSSDSSSSTSDKE